MRRAADLHEVGGAVARPAAARRRSRALPRARRRDRHPPRRRPQQLSDQRRDGAARAAGAVDRVARRGARSCGGARPRRPRHAPWLVHERPRGRWSASDRRGTRASARRAAENEDAHPARAHRRTGNESRPPLRASGGDHRPRRRPGADRRVPRHLPPARRGLRHLQRRRLRAHLRGLRPHRRSAGDPRLPPE